LTTTEFPPGYAGTTRLLNRMAFPECNHNFKRDGGYHRRFCESCSLLKVRKIPKEQNAPLYFHLPHIKALNRFNHEHERACADLYCTYSLTWNVKYWEAVPAEEFLELGFAPDRSSIIDGRIIFWEIDKGTETLAVIRKKVERYIQLSRLHPERKFHVVFTATRGRAKSILLDVLLDFKRGNQFLVAEHQSVVKNPYGEVLVSPKEPAKWLKLTDLEV